MRVCFERDGDNAAFVRWLVPTWSAGEAVKKRIGKVLGNASQWNGCESHVNEKSGVQFDGTRMRAMAHHGNLVAQKNALLRFWLPTEDQ